MPLTGNFPIQESDYYRFLIEEKQKITDFQSEESLKRGQELNFDEALIGFFISLHNFNGNLPSGKF